MGSWLESHRGRRNNLGANDISGHQHLGAHPGRTDNHRQACNVQSRRPVAGSLGRFRARPGRRRNPRQLGMSMLRIDTHHHMVPPGYRKALRRAGIEEAGGRALPDWSPAGSLQTMAELRVATAILSVSTPGTTFLPDVADAAALARDLNDYAADLVASQPDQFGFFATVPMPHIPESVSETVRALDELNADGVVLLANNDGTYLGEEGQDDLWARA